MADEDPDDAVLSDVDGDDDPSPIVLPSPVQTAIPTPSTENSDHPRLRELLADLEQERRARQAVEASLAELQTSFSRLKSIAHDLIKKRDDALRDKDDASRSREEALRLKDEAVQQKDALRSEMESASQMLVSGISKISSKVSAFKNFSSSGGLPQSQKYAGMPAVAYGVIKRSNEIVEELVKQIEAAAKSRDQAREQVEQRNYEIAIEVSELEATIAGLREDVTNKDEEIEGLSKMVAERDTRISEMDQDIAELRQFGQDCDGKLRMLEAKVDSQRPLLIDQMNYISKAYGEIHEIIKIADANASDQSDSSDSLFMWREMDMDENLRTSLEGIRTVYDVAKAAREKVGKHIEDRNEEAKALNEKINGLLGEKQHIGILLRSALSSKTSDVLQVAEDGLREARIDLKLNANDSHNSKEEKGTDEVYTLAGVLENTVKTSQLKIIELQHLVEALRAESSLLKAHMDAQEKEISQQKHQIRELAEKERMADENVEGLMMDIASAEEEIARWKAAAEQEAAAGRAVEQEVLTQLSALRQELNEAKQALLESENKLKFKEETAAAAISARDAAEKSLKLADSRSTRLRQRLDELTQQLEQSDTRDNSRSSNDHRYVCWPWQWLGLNFVRYQIEDTRQSSNEMELSEPLI